jgi:hypothetical protein
MAQAKYVIVCGDGTSYDLSGRAQFMEWGKAKAPRFDLQDLLSQGWAPARETGMHTGGLKRHRERLRRAPPPDGGGGPTASCWSASPPRGAGRLPPPSLPLRVAA